MKHIKHTGFALMLLLMLPLAAMLVSAEEVYNIDKVFVNGVQVDGDRAQVEIGQDVEVVVEVLATQMLNEARDAKVTVEIDGYEHDAIRESTDVFTLSPGNVRYRKTLNLELPTNMEGDTYTLYVRVSDRLDTVEKTFMLYVEQTRHLIDLLGVSVTPTPYVNAGDVAIVKVRLGNVGAKTEENVKVVAAVEALKVYDVEWLDLVPSEIVGDDEEDSETVMLLLPIPEETETGVYEVAVGVSYNDGYKNTAVKTTFNVKGVEKEEPTVASADGTPAAPVIDAKPVDPAKALVIAIDATSQTVSQGKETAYKISLSNLGASEKLLTFSAAGAQLFGDVRVDPSTLTIPGGQKADVYVYAKAKKDAEAKTHTFTVRVMDGEKLAKELLLSASVEEAVADEKSGNLLPLDDETLKIAFIVLVVVLIVIGLLIAFRRVRGEDYPIEPLEERTYY